MTTPDGLDASTWLDNKRASAAYLWPPSKGAGAVGSSWHEHGIVDGGAWDTA